MMKNTYASLSRTIYSFVTLVAMGLIPISSDASQSMHEKVEEGAKQYLLSQLADNSQDTSTDVSIVKIDDRINIPNCPTGFQYHASPEALAQSYISVRVSCGDNDWYLFTSGQVTRTTEIVVTQGAVSPERF